MESLKPFTPEKGIDGVALKASAQLQNGLLILEYQLHDPKHIVQDAPHAQSWKGPELPRIDGLWQTTCFEAFAARPGENSYWEFNVSPKGAWQIYHFENYRKPQPPRESHDFEMHELKCEEGLLRAEFKTRIPISALELSFCTVLQPRLTGPVSYYSSHHAGEKADFHLRGSLNIKIGNV